MDNPHHKSLPAEELWWISPALGVQLSSLGYVHTEFKEFDDATLGDLGGYPFPEAPEWSVAIGGQYTFRNGFYFVFEELDYAATLGDRRSFGVNAKVKF